jgi:hypothetical protein
MSLARDEASLGRFLADHLGLVDDQCPSAAALRADAAKAPMIYGVARLGWTDDADAFLHGGEVLSPPKAATGRYELYAPKDTMLSEARKVFTPKGDREEQYRGLRDLWGRSEEFKLVVSLACISPFLEIAEAPSIAFHLAGPTGIGKTTLLRLGISVFADPNSALTCVDFAKDTQNFADAQLGLLHNFPILLDETTTQGDPSRLAELFYSIAAGHTKGRLTGPEQGYLPSKPQTYALVCFLSGEVSLREHIELRGAAARLVELVVEEPLLPKSELSAWRSFADSHHGWFGRDLMERQMGLHLSSAFARTTFKNMYAGYKRVTQEWCSDHSRTLDALAGLQIGYRMAATLLDTDASFDAAEGFARTFYGRLNKTTKLGRLIGAFSDSEHAAEWAKSGFIPCEHALTIAREFGFKDNKGLLSFLENHGIAKKIQPRKLTAKMGSEQDSGQCYILTPNGKARLQAAAVKL